jgi:hypothetical protein
MSLCGTILFRIEDLWSKKSMGMRSKLKQFPANKNFDLMIFPSYLHALHFTTGFLSNFKIKVAAFPLCLLKVQCNELLRGVEQFFLIISSLHAAYAS